MVWAHGHILSGAVILALTAGPVAAETIVYDTTEFPRETEALIAATVSLFEAAEADGDSDETRGLELAPIPTSSDGARIGAPIGALTTEHGPVRHLTGYRITWYPVDTLLGAVDFMGTWDRNRNLVCGYVTWDLSDPENPVMRDLVANYVDVSKLPIKDRAGMELSLLDANCAFGDVDQNYAALN